MNSEDPQSTAHKVGGFIGTMVFYAVVLAAIVLACFTIGGMVAIGVEGYEWVRSLRP
jgi:hypothetical protein